ncbi:MAG: hypothetical protein MRY74_17135 [Neomegalonema sp.]|nr:hypothetical protein [Neomegalonema sp.]
MAIEYDGDLARIVGGSDVAEALDFSEWLAGGARRVELGEATHLHSAIVQCLQQFQPEIVTAPGDEFLALIVEDAYRTTG